VSKAPILTAGRGLDSPRLHLLSDLVATSFSLRQNTDHSDVSGQISMRTDDYEQPLRVVSISLLYGSVSWRGKHLLVSVYAGHYSFGLVLL
jgi:hypothetical protein